MSLFIILAVYHLVKNSLFDLVTESLLVLAEFTFVDFELNSNMMARHFFIYWIVPFDEVYLVVLLNLQINGNHLIVLYIEE